MPGSRANQFVDRDTGATVHVETTKSAKARYRRQGAAQWTPTKGQINAAEIWNKQEEKIRKDREREVRKKKNVLRQAEKDARQKEIQQEMLRKGRLTVEDTWGKINASQNRLHKFFGAAHGSTERVNPSLACNGIDSDGDENTDEEPHGQATFLNPTLHRTGHENLRHETEDENSAAIGSPRIDSAETEGNKTEHRSIAILSNISASSKSHPVRVASTSDGFPASRLQSVSQTGSIPPQRLSQSLMPPPPPRPRLTHPMEEQLHLDNNNGSSAQQQAGLELKESSDTSTIGTTSDISTIISTQIVNDTLFGLSSQDFVDDMDVDQEDVHEQLDTDLHERGSSTADRVASSTTTGDTNLTDDDTLCAENDYNDWDIDDETLLALAATQRVKAQIETDEGKQLFEQDVSHDMPETDQDEQSPPGHIPRDRGPLQASNSFAMSGVDDDDLLECMQLFEEQKQEDPSTKLFSIPSTGNKSERMNRPASGFGKRSRRVLPWEKNPVG